MSNEEIDAMQNELRREALSLCKRVIEYYHSKGVPEPEKGFAAFLQRIAEKLAQKPVDAVWIKENIWGIFRIVSDDYCLERSALGEDLYSFKDRAREFAERITTGRNSGAGA